MPSRFKPLFSDYSSLDKALLSTFLPPPATDPLVDELQDSNRDQPATLESFLISVRDRETDWLQLIYENNPTIVELRSFQKRNSEYTAGLRDCFESLKTNLVNAETAVERRNKTVHRLRQERNNARAQRDAFESTAHQLQLELTTFRAIGLEAKKISRRAAHDSCSDSEPEYPHGSTPQAKDPLYLKLHQMEGSRLDTTTRTTIHEVGSGNRRKTRNGTTKRNERSGDSNTRNTKSNSHGTNRKSDWEEEVGAWPQALKDKLKEKNLCRRCLKPGHRPHHTDAPCKHKPSKTLEEAITELEAYDVSDSELAALEEGSSFAVDQEDVAEVMQSQIP